MVCLGRYKNIRGVLGQSPRVVTHLWWSGRQKPPLYPHGSPPGRWKSPDRWPMLSLSSAENPPFHIWCRTWQQRATATVKSNDTSGPLREHRRSIPIIGGLKKPSLIKRMQSADTEIESRLCKLVWCARWKLLQRLCHFWWNKDKLSKAIKTPCCTHSCAETEKRQQLCRDEGMAKWKVLSAGTLTVPLFQYL